MKLFKSLFFAFIVLSLLFLAACSDGDDANNSDSNSDNNSNEDVGTTDEKVTIKLGAQNDNKPATQALIDAFNESQDKYVVEWDPLTNDSAQMHDQLLNSLNSGSSEYDVLSLDVVWAGEFAGAGFLEPIDVFMNGAGFSKDQFNA